MNEEQRAFPGAMTVSPIHRYRVVVDIDVEVVDPFRVREDSAFMIAAGDDVAIDAFTEPECVTSLLSRRIGDALADIPGLDVLAPVVLPYAADENNFVPQEIVLAPRAYVLPPRDGASFTDQE